jgi:hypothetical protein
VTTEEYGEWADQHAKAFGLTFDGELAALGCWYDSLRVFTPAELHAATASMLASGETFRRVSDHLPAVIVRVRGARREQAREEDTAAAIDPDLGSCDLCGSSGHVGVPLVRVLVGEVKIMADYETVVVCRCAKGRWVQDRQNGMSPRQMTLDQYQQLNPDWRDQMAERRAHARQVALDQRAADVAAGVRRSEEEEAWDRLMERLLRRYAPAAAAGRA